MATLKPTTPLLTPNKGPLKPASPLHPKNAPKTPISHPQRRRRFQLAHLTGPQRRRRFQLRLGLRPQRRWRFQPHTDTSKQRRHRFQESGPPGLQDPDAIPVAGGGAWPGDQWAADVTNVVKPTRFKSPREDLCYKRRQSKQKISVFGEKALGLTTFVTTRSRTPQNDCNTSSPAKGPWPSCGAHRQQRHHHLPNFARNLSWSFFEIPQKRCNSNDANSMFKQVAGELRAKLMGGGGAWSDHETTRQAKPQQPSPTGVEGAGGICRGSGRRRRGLAGAQDNAPSQTSATQPHWRGGRRRVRMAWLRCPWAVAGPGRASRRRAERSSRRGRLAGGPPPTGTQSSPAPQPDPTAPGTPVGPQATQPRVLTELHRTPVATPQTTKPPGPTGAGRLSKYQRLIAGSR